MNAESAYECATCRELFEDFEEAANCCGDGYYDVFICSKCGASYYTEYETEQCCQEEQNDH